MVVPSGNDTFVKSVSHRAPALAGGWVDDGVPVHDDGWDRLVAVSHRPDESGCVGVCPDVDLVD